MNTSPLKILVSTLALALLILLTPTLSRAETVGPSSPPSVGKSTRTPAKQFVPEPSSFMLLGTGLVLAALVLRSKGIGLR